MREPLLRPQSRRTASRFPLICHRLRGRGSAQVESPQLLADFESNARKRLPSIEPKNSSPPAVAVEAANPPSPAGYKPDFFVHKVEHAFDLA